MYVIVLYIVCRQIIPYSKMEEIYSTVYYNENKVKCEKIMAQKLMKAVDIGIKKKKNPCNRSVAKLDSEQDLTSLLLFTYLPCLTKPFMFLMISWEQCNHFEKE